MAPPEELLARARRALQDNFGYSAFRAGQERAVATVLEGRDTLVVLPTGGGKSLCYQVPALVLPKLTVVISPLISLMKDQVDALTARGLAAAFLNSTLSSGEVSDRLARAQRGELRMLYVAPERFDFGSTGERLRAMGVSLLAVDEAHCISEWGHDFRPSYLRVRAARERLGDPPTIALTATATPDVRKDIARQLALRSPVVIITGFDRANLKYAVHPTSTEREKDDALVHALKNAEGEGLAVVYAPTRKAVERVTAVLDRARVPAAAYHAGLDDDNRRDVQDAFMQERVRAIVATNAFGMGIDKPNVRLVVHHAMPGTLEAYYQEAGRAGRDGAPASCLLLHAFPDRFTHEFFIKSAYPERPLIEQVYELARRAARGSGIVSLDPGDMSSSIGGKTSPRAIESALRVLTRGGALETIAPAQGRVFVRLLATPQRITRELGGDDDPHRGLLRALWRVVGAKLHDGVTIDLDGLPPGLGGSATAMPLLDALQLRQFLFFERVGGGMRLVKAASALSAFPIDWRTHDNRRRSELAKLDAMQKYAYTTGCRRAFVLRYFGDDSARAECSGCDNCLGTRMVRAESPQRRSRSRSSGAGDDRLAPTREGSRTKGRGATAADAPATLDERDTRLFVTLKRLRGEIAKHERVPAYIVFTDRTLAELAVRRPRSSAAMLEVRGVGETRLARFGDRFLNAIRTDPETEVT